MSYEKLNEGNPKTPEDETLNAVPVPDDMQAMAALDQVFMSELTTKHLENLLPIDSPEHLALHVALLTGTVAEQQARLATLERTLTELIGDGWLTNP